MASREEKVTEFLTCVVCQELYTKPCTLRCDHTFCRKCVTSYIQTRPDAAQSKTIPCPCCRQDTKVPHPSRPVEEWAGQIKPSIIIQGLIDTQKPSASSAGTNSFCWVCDELGEITPGTFWCSECEVPLCKRCAKMHRANPASRDHEVCDLSGEEKVKRRRKAVCREHNGEVIKFVCKDCHKAVCQTCCIIYHRKCESVVTMESLKPTMKFHLRKSVHVLSKKIDRKLTLVKKARKKMRGIEKTEVAVEGHIKSAVKRVIAKIKHKEKQLIDEVKDITDKQTRQLKADIIQEEIKMQIYRQHYEFMDQALLSDRKVNLYDAYQTWQSGAVEMEDVRDTKAADTRRIDAILFTPDTDEVLKALDNLQLGKIDITYQDQGTCLPSPVLVHTIDTRVAGDEGGPVLLNVIVLVVDGAQTCVVTDFNNKCVKCFFTRNNEAYHSKLPLGNSPNGMTQLNEKRVMVAVPESRQIVTVEVTPVPVLLSTITTCTGYCNLAVLNPSSLAAGTWGYVDILDMAGHVLRSVTTNNDDQLFTYPWYMCVNNKGNILVSDYWKKSVTCLTSEGDVVWRYIPTGERTLINPRGITTTSTGDIVLADRDKVVQLTESGEFVRDYRDTVGYPRGLYVDRHDTMYVCDQTQILEFQFM
ncbi:tripartite motif-containing protein 2-like [Haliotis asinina]|uniref:tripartite motif-containing protein 2-like n=1 Tax=Haliotis asinina TaxID=109174 RepID=UPI003531B43B